MICKKITTFIFFKFTIKKNCLKKLIFRYFLKYLDFLNVQNVNKDIYLHCGNSGGKAYRRR